ncbi:MAG: ribonuclease Y [Candidatus Yonathbacteria bacterium RIFCSPHIGHO2_01_FULL_51_10]|uniref:Ribonuclease Y n=1 Tax=Candidatus Yonathbacteria bacterium RIFCSPHIGHO2_01_FULL_51_10 TaxID=1802723 RepID=A0A1G2S5P9_9BACT|nr:MAG: ribonuclease Y [Bdellovibrionales bacterium RIFOXYD1_FULL_53_11]OHA80386.1 MAG: ribonuclease Y [Candidatus Yonathbacteria bacterium RIFCSPHIGHO2_01_FULL_51_10]
MLSIKFALALAAMAGVVGIALGYVLRLLLTLGKKGTVELEIKQLLLGAKEEAQKITEEAEKKAVSITEEARKEEKEKQSHFKQTEDRLIKKEELLDRRQGDIDSEAGRLKEREQELEALTEQANRKNTQTLAELERVSKLSAEDARKELLTRIERESEEDLLVRIKKLELEGVEKLEQKAKDILATSIQRLASSTASETMATAVSIPSEDIKGKIIGKEGRNIRAFERAAGVELIVDDTPGAIVVSSFDPVRRQIARIALENLILDGRIQPVKIEEMVEKSRETIGKIIKEKGEQAAYECGVFNLDPRLIAILGRLYFRTSYGQNVLQHSTEMAHIAGMIAQELGADVAIARAGALLHDIGKAVDHEVQGTHVEIGRRILQKFGVDERIVKAMQSHHEEYPYETIESIIVQTADAISGGRPGARRDSVENYIKRLQDLEAIANSFEGVEKSYAIQAGREIRVFVTPDKVADIEARNLAREIALRVENELKYPGEIRVNVIRELRVLEYAR